MGDKYTVTQTSKILGIGRSHVIRMIRKRLIEPDDMEAGQGGNPRYMFTKEHICNLASQMGLTPDFSVFDKSDSPAATAEVGYKKYVAKIHDSYASINKNQIVIGNKSVFITKAGANQIKQMLGNAVKIYEEKLVEVNL
jgi:hypothetical protein